MDSVQMDRRIITKLAFGLFLVLILVLFLLGCDPRSGEYPHELHKEWLCEEPQITLSFDYNQDGILSSSEVIKTEDGLLSVYFGMNPSFFKTFKVESDHYTDKLLFGSWEYREGKLVLHIEEDLIFNNRYSSLEFTPVENQKKDFENTAELTVTVAGVQIAELKNGIYLGIQPWNTRAYLVIPGDVSSNVDLEALRTIRDGDRIFVRVDANKKDYLDTAEFIKIYSLATEDKTIFTVDDYNEWINK